MEELRIKEKEMLEEFRETIENIDITYDYEDSYNQLYGALWDYINEAHDYDFEDIGCDIVDYDYAEEYIKHELETGGLARLYYAMGDIRPDINSIFRIDGYGNLASVTIEDLEYMRDEIMDLIFDKLENLKEDNENE